MNTKISVLLSIYHKENPSFFNEAMESVWDQQTFKPTQIVLVEDGKLTDELYATIDVWQNKLGSVLKRVPLETNQGLGKALNIGLKYCEYDIIGRMDTDDIAAPDRFEKQVAFLEKNPEIDIVGAQIQEFNQEIGDVDFVRKLPLSHNDIIKFAKKRNPFNHPVVMYRKAAVFSAGSYQADYLFEDYGLWVRMLINGVKSANLPDILLYMRSGNELFTRRGGLKYAISETKMQYKFHQQGFLSIFGFLKNLLVRFPVRIMPNSLRKFIYTKMLRN